MMFDGLDSYHEPVCSLHVAEPDLVRLIILRMLVDMDRVHCLFSKDGYYHREIVLFLGLDPANQKCDHQQDIEYLQHQYAAAISRAEAGWPYSSVLHHNLKALQERIGLNDVECKLLACATLFKTDCLLVGTLRCPWEENQLFPASLSTLHGLFSALAVLVGESIEAVTAALSPSGKLIRSGLLSIDDPDGRSDIFSAIELMSPTFMSNLLLKRCGADEFLSGIVRLGKHATLDESHYAHVANEYRWLKTYLAQSLESGKSGVNMLIYGRPGTGKSELVRLQASELDVTLLEVASENEYGNSIVGKSRLRSCKVAQRMFRSGQAMILFDEVQDIFGDGSLAAASTAKARKAEVNNLLEDNPLPMFWLTNSVDAIDPSFIRRFDMVLKLDMPALRSRQCIIADALAGLPVPEQVCMRFARHEHLAPALVPRAADVVRSMQGIIDSDEMPALMEHLLNQTRTPQGHQAIQKSSAHDLPDLYHLGYLNADANLENLAAGVIRHPSARICLYGPPGTGKSAFARWLAQTLDRPLHARKMSDVLSMWVGGTESNLKQLFGEAERDQAVLLLDEVDGLLQDRRQAQRSWEVTGVNEMLVQMEGFNGVFIASTNLMDSLDQAALRRFDIKIKLDYLLPEQAYKLFVMLCQALNIQGQLEQDEKVIRQIGNLTPGDFATVSRRHRFSPFADTASLCRALQLECQQKEGGRRRKIGFV